MAIRSCIAAAGLLALAACGGSGTKSDGNSAAAKGASGAEVKLQPGQWETSVEAVNVSAPGLPPAALAAMKQPKVTSTSCMTPEDVNGPSGDMFGGTRNGKCKSEGFSWAGGRIAGTTTCEGANGMGKTTMAMSGQYGPQSFDMTMKMTSDMQGRPMTVESRVTGRRIGECAPAKAG